MSDLWGLQVLFASSASWGMTFASEEKARAVYEVLAARGEERVEVEDDYGLKWSLVPAAVECLQLTDLGALLEGEAEKGLLQARARAKLERRAAADPMLPKHAGPIILPNGGMRQ